MAKYFITGGAGFIGSHLVDKLIEQGNEVTAYDNLSRGKVDYIKHHFDNKNFKFIEADLLNLDKLNESIQGHDLVYHLAANQDLRIALKDTSVDLYQEAVVTYNVLEAMRRNGINKIIYTSSGTVYGDTPVIPIPENYGPTLPISLYGAGKLAGEALITAFCHTFDMQSWIYRFANIIGPRATHAVMYDFVNKLRENPHELEILGDGTQERPFLHVQECIEGMFFGFEHANERVNLFNLGCESYTDIRTVAEILVEEMGLNNINFKFTGGKRGWPGDVPQVRCNIDKIKALGWQPKLTSDEAVRRTAKEMVEELRLSNQISKKGEE